MTNEYMMEEVLHKAHQKGIYEEVDKIAKELRYKNNLSLQESYIKAYYEVKDKSEKIK